MDRRIATSWEDRERQRVHDTRQRHEKLRQRLLNPSVRVTGRDVSALQQQIADKRNKAQHEKQLDREYNQYLCNVQNMLREKEIQDEEKEMEKKMMHRREWKQLSEERAKQKHDEELQRKQEEMMTTATASIMRFDGEDECYPERKSLQQRQMRQWIKNSLDSKMTKQQRDAIEEAQRYEQQKLFAQHSDKIEEENRQELLRKRKEVQAYNQFLAETRNQSKRFENDVLDAQNNAAKCSVLPDGSSLDVHVNNPNRYRRDHFRGLSEEKISEFREYQKQQMKEREERIAQEKEDEKIWAEQQKRILEISNQANYFEQDEKRKQERQYLEQQRAQMEEAHQRKLEEKTFHCEEPAFSEDFFSKFGQSHR